MTIPYSDLVSKVRIYTPGSLLPLIAVKSVFLAKSEDMIQAGGRVFTPWGLASIAQISLEHGHELGTVAVEADLNRLCLMFNSVADPFSSEGDGGLRSSLPAFLVRMAGEQFSFQQGFVYPIARLKAMADLIESTTDARILTTAWLESLLDGSVDSFISCATVLYAGALAGSGTFPAGWLSSPERYDQRIDAILPWSEFAILATAHFVGERDSYRRIDSRSLEVVGTDLRRYDFNPLEDRPLVRMPDGSVLSPSVDLILRKASVRGLYYLAVDRLDQGDADAFSDDLGRLFERYVEKQLVQLVGVSILPEVTYADGRKTVDWIASWPGGLVLIECKSTPMRSGRMGDEGLEDDLNRTLGKAFEQLNTTNRLLRDREPALDHISTDSPRYGLVVTRERYWMANVGFVRDLITTQPELPTLVISIDELEALVTLGLEDGGSALDSLVSVMSDDERREWELDASIDWTDTEWNPVIDEAWHRLPFGQPRDT